MRRLAAAGVLTLLFGACGSPGGAGSDAARDAVLAAVSTTEDAGSARFEGDMSFPFPKDAGDGVPNIAMTFEGLMDLDGRRARMTMTFEELPETPGVSGLGFEMIIDKNFMYMKSPFLSDALGGSKPWLRMDLSEIAGSSPQFSQTDPTQFLQYLSAVSDDVEKLGRDKVRGTGTTQYHATVDLSEGLEGLSEEQREQLQAGIDQLGTSEFPANLWIDDQGRLRRMYVEFDLSGIDEESEDSKMTMTFDIFDFGVKFDIEVPPESQVQDAPDGLFSTAGA